MCSEAVGGRRRQWQPIYSDNDAPVHVESLLSLSLPLPFSIFSLSILSSPSPSTSPLVLSSSSTFPFFPFPPPCLQSGGKWKQLGETRAKERGKSGKVETLTRLRKSRAHSKEIDGLPIAFTRPLMVGCSRRYVGEGDGRKRLVGRLVEKTGETETGITNKGRCTRTRYKGISSLSPVSLLFYQLPRRDHSGQKDNAISLCCANISLYSWPYCATGVPIS